jgi:hypothetical protein
LIDFQVRSQKLCATVDHLLGVGWASVAAPVTCIEPDFPDDLLDVLRECFGAATRANGRANSKTVKVIANTAVSA